MEEILIIDPTPISVLNDISIDLSLNEIRKSDITKLVTEYGETFSNKTGCTDAIVHTIAYSLELLYVLECIQPQFICGLRLRRRWTCF